MTYISHTVIICSVKCNSLYEICGSAMHICMMFFFFRSLWMAQSKKSVISFENDVN